MKQKVIESVVIETPRGVATVQNGVWSSEDKVFELELNANFGGSSDFVTPSHFKIGVADEILADRATSEYCGKIIEIKEKIIHIKNSKDIRD